jgi:uncharacterized protein
MRRVNYFPLLFIVFISLLLDWYAFQGLKVLASVLEIPQRILAYYVFWGASLTVLAAFLMNFYKAIPTGKFTLLFNTVFNGFLTVFVTKIVFVAVLFFEDVYRAVMGLLYTYPERSLLLSQIAFIIACIPFFSFLFGVTRGKYHYKVRKTKLYLNDLPDQFQGFTIAQISDVHSGSLDNPKAVQRGIDLINKQQADVFVFTGDLVNNEATEIEPWIAHFRQIRAKYGKFSVLGNHDYGDYIRWGSADEKIRNLSRLKENHDKLEFKLLLDQHVLIEKGGQSLALVGVENWGIGFGQRGDLNKALKGLSLSTVKILLSHDPSHWDAEVKNHPANIHLTLSGHTHGMQFGIELFGMKWSPVKYRYKNWAGLAAEQGRYLYVNRGFGFLGFAGRVGIWPEITIIELHQLKPQS